MCGHGQYVCPWVHLHRRFNMHADVDEFTQSSRSRNIAAIDDLRISTPR